MPIGSRATSRPGGFFRTGRDRSLAASTEKVRLAVLQSYAVVDTPAEAAFDHITQLVAEVLGVPIAMISLLDADTLWAKSRYGIDFNQAPRAIAFCDHTIRGFDVMAVEDMSKDARFADNPLVAGEEAFRFYAGAPLISPEGFAVGTLSVLDRKPRRLEPREAILLRGLAAQVVHELAVRVGLGDLYGEIDSGREAKRQLSSSRREFDALLNATGSAAITFDRSGSILSWNLAAEQLFGYTADAAQGMSIDSILPVPDQTAARSIGTDTPQMGRHKDGRTFPVDMTRADWQSESGEAAAGVILQDATERRLAEEELRRSRAHLAEAVRIGGLGSWDWNVKTNEIKLSDAMCQQLGLPLGTVRSPEAALSIIHPEDQQHWRDVMARRIAGEHVPVLTYRTRQPDGTIRAFQSIGQLVQQDDGPHLVGVVRDITAEAAHDAERRRHLEELRRSQLHLAEAQRIGMIGSWDWHLPTGRIVPSDEMRNLIGLAPGETRTHAEARESAHPEDRDAWQAAMDRMAAGEKVAPVNFRLVRPDGSVRTFQTSGKRVEEEDGMHVIGVLKDITERVQREAERRETEKLAALGQLAGGVAHEINNLLQPVITLAEIVGEDLAEQQEPDLVAEMRDHMNMVAKCGRDARDIVKKILRYARKEMPTLEPTDVVETLKGAVGMVHELLSPGVQVNIDVAPDLLGVAKINGSEMTQVVTNLAVNADHAMKGQGRLGIRLERKFLTPVQATAATVTPGPYFIIRVSDTGSGMDAETKARIFDPFFTTKPLGQGTGLGLSMVQGILQSWQGSITVDSTVGKGTTFSLYIPAIDESDLPTK